MTKPPLGKVEALLYVLQHVTTKGCARIMTHPRYAKHIVVRTPVGVRATVCQDARLVRHVVDVPQC